MPDLNNKMASGGAQKKATILLKLDQSAGRQDC